MCQENSIETCILSRVKQITSPGWMHETSAPTWCTGKTQRDRVEREVGAGIGMGNTCKPMAVSFQCMTKFTTIKKKKLKKKCFAETLWGVRCLGGMSYPFSLHSSAIHLYLLQNLMFQFFDLPMCQAHKLALGSTTKNEMCQNRTSLCKAGSFQTFRI